MKKQQKTNHKKGIIDNENEASVSLMHICRIYNRDSVNPVSFQEFLGVVQPQCITILCRFKDI